MSVIVRKISSTNLNGSIIGFIHRKSTAPVLISSDGLYSESGPCVLYITMNATNDERKAVSKLTFSANPATVRLKRLFLCFCLIYGATGGTYLPYERCFSSSSMNLQKLRMIFLPSGVMMLSGWNWTPWNSQRQPLAHSTHKYTAPGKHRQPGLKGQRKHQLECPCVKHWGVEIPGCACTSCGGRP